MRGDTKRDMTIIFVDDCGHNNYNSTICSLIGTIDIEEGLGGIISQDNKHCYVYFESKMIAVLRETNSISTLN